MSIIAGWLHISSYECGITFIFHILAINVYLQLTFLFLKLRKFIENKLQITKVNLSPKLFLKLPLQAVPHYHYHTHFTLPFTCYFLHFVLAKLYAIFIAILQLIYYRLDLLLTVLINWQNWRVKRRGWANKNSFKLCIYTGQF